MIQLNAPPDPSSFNPLRVLGAALGVLVALGIVAVLLPLVLRFVISLAAIVVVAAVAWWVWNHFRNR